MSIKLIILACGTSVPVNCAGCLASMLKLPYLLASSEIVFGNSGGSLMRFSEKRDRYEMIGIPSRASAAGFSIIEHMGWSIRIDTIREFLISERVEYIINE